MKILARNTRGINIERITPITPIVHIESPLSTPPVSAPYPDSRYWLAIYYGNVYVKNGKANWIIMEDAFAGDNRYYLAVKSINGFVTIDCTKWGSHEKRPSNKKRQLLHREYIKYEGFCVG